MMAFSMVTTAGYRTPDQSGVSRPYDSVAPCWFSTWLVPGALLWPCVGLRAHQHQSTSYSFSQAWRLAHHVPPPPGADSALALSPNPPNQAGEIPVGRVSPPFLLICWK